MTTKDNTDLPEPAPAACDCEACHPQGTPFSNEPMRFIVCAICGNKRCPHATDHRNACTNSNDPGQEGSSYKDAPKRGELWPAAPAQAAPDDLVERLRAIADDKDADAPSFLRARIREAADTLARLRAELDVAKADRNTYDHAHKRQAAATLEQSARAERAEADLAAVRADAERYRWLRSRFRVFSPQINGQHHWCATGELGYITGPTLDAAIDAARAAK